jgi:hypothetical protein
VVDRRLKARTIEDAEFIRAAERRIEAHLEEIEQAKSEGRLPELIRDTPSIRDQLGEPTQTSM